MSSEDLTTEPPGRAHTSILVIMSLGRKLLNKVIMFLLYAFSAFSGNNTSRILLSLAALAILFASQSDPTPTPTPTPLPF